MLIVLDNVLIKDHAANGIYITNTTDLRVSDVTMTNCARTSPQYGVGVIPYYGISSIGNKILYNSATPSVLTWAVGDTCYNSVPSVGQPKGWRCTTAGTPGTWTSEGNL
jgi:hypothetical protein